MFSVVSLRYTSSTIGSNKKTEFWSEIILVNAGLKEKGLFFSPHGRTPHNSNLCKMTIVFSDSQTCCWQGPFLL